MIGSEPVDVEGFPPGRTCPACGEPLEPGHIDDSLQLVWLCPSHGLIERTIDPLRGPCPPGQARSPRQ